MPVLRLFMVEIRQCLFQLITELIILFHCMQHPKKSTELLAECYSHLFGINCTGLRFFTVYGPWGGPDMATFILREILEEENRYF